MSTTTYEVKSPAAILAEDVICQSFIQSSSTLAYACLLIRQGKYDLAANVLHSLEAKPASRFKDMVFYLQAQIGIETGDFSTIKKRLVPRVGHNPNDLVALSLLESCIAREWEDWHRGHPAEPAPAAAPARAQTPAPPASAAPSPAPAAPGEGLRTLVNHFETPIAFEPTPEAAAPAMQAASPAPVQAAPPSAASAAFAATQGGDFGVYQVLAADAQTLALALWNTVTRKFHFNAKRREHEDLVNHLPQLMPDPLSGPVRSLEGGIIHKVCFCFKDLTVTTLHSDAENLGLLTGNLNQSLLTMVRADNLFQRQSPLSEHARASAKGTAAGHISRESALEVTSNE